MPTDGQQPECPKCKALLLCDTTIQEEGTGKISLIGVFATFFAKEFPSPTRPFQVFLQITNARGEYDLRVEVRDRQRAEEVIAHAAGLGIRVDDPLQTCNVVIPVPMLPVEHEGPYDLVVLANGEEVERQSFQVVQIKPGDDEA